MAIANLETEYKFRSATPQTLEALAAAPSLAGHPLISTGEKRVADTYVETPGLHLWQAGLALRARRSARGCLLGLKEAGSATAGLHVRGEIEQEGELSLSISALPVGKIREILLEKMGDQPLQALVTLHQERRLFEFRQGDLALAELSLDQVRFGNDPHPTSFGVELESKSPQSQPLMEAVAQALREQYGLTDEPCNKLEVAFDAERLPTLQCGALLQEATSAQAARARLGKTLWKFLGAKRGFLGERDQISVGVLESAAREMENALGQMEPCFAPELIASLRAQNGLLLGMRQRGENILKIISTKEQSRFEKMSLILALAEEWGVK